MNVFEPLTLFTIYELGVTNDECVRFETFLKLRIRCDERRMCSMRYS